MVAEFGDAELLELAGLLGIEGQLEVLEHGVEVLGEPVRVVLVDVVPGYPLQNHHFEPALHLSDGHLLVHPVGGGQDQQLGNVHFQEGIIEA